MATSPSAITESSATVARSHSSASTAASTGAACLASTVPSLFGRLLDDRQGGFWQICPVGPHSCRQEYTGKTNILRTIFQTDQGLVQVVDFMPVDAHDVKQHAHAHRTSPDRAHGHRPFRQEPDANARRPPSRLRPQVQPNES